jgi:hypothetical protein
MYDETEATVTFSSPVGMCGKLARLVENPRCALAFFSRDHGLGSAPGFVLVQGIAEVQREASPEFIAALHTAWPRFLPPIPDSGWKRRLGRGYYDWRVPVRIRAERVIHWPSGWPDPGLGPPGAPSLGPAPAPQQPPARGVATRVPGRRWRKQFERSPHRLIGYVGGDRLPVVVPVTASATDAGLDVVHPDLPPGGRRAGYFGFWFENQLAGQGGLMATGWLDGSDGDGHRTYSIHTSTAFNVPRSMASPRTIVPLEAGVQHRIARHKGLVDRGVWLGDGQRQS